MSPAFALGMMCTMTSALRTRRADMSNHEVGAYTFANFADDFGRTYAVGSEEYTRRTVVFEQSVAQISAQNARGGQSWTAGPHPFMDWTAEERERLHGYVPSGSRKQKVVALQSRTNSSLRVFGGSGDGHVATTPPVINQGDLCGSCWAWASVQAVEAQLMKTDTPWRTKQYGSPMTLSTQAVLECAPNPHSCGGPGGCQGATGEVALDYIRDSGIPLEADLSYHPSHIEKCPLDPYPVNTARVRIAGWRALPSNQAQPLMQALVEDGPVIVAADSRKWYDYLSGIFDDCPKDAVVNHAVLAKGYGEASGKKYWMIQNSWGTRWGEDGTMRLLRHDDEDSYCGTDRHPEEGFACDGSTKPATVCGTCGLLFDPIIPENPQIEAAQSSSSQGQTSWQPESAQEQADAAISSAPAVAPTAAVSGEEKMEQIFGQHSSSTPSADATIHEQFEMPAVFSPPDPSIVIEDATKKSWNELPVDDAPDLPLAVSPSEHNAESAESPSDTGVPAAVSPPQFHAEPSNSAGMPAGSPLPPSDVETASVPDGVSKSETTTDAESPTSDNPTSLMPKPESFTAAMSHAMSPVVSAAQDITGGNAGAVDVSPPPHFW